MLNLSPSNVQRPSKAIATSSTPGSKKQLKFDMHNTSPTKTINKTLITKPCDNKIQASNNTLSSYDKSHDIKVTEPINTIQEHKILSAVKTNQSLAIAEVISNNCPNIELAVKRKLLNNLNQPVTKLCVRKGKPTDLKNSQYEGLTEFHFNMVWKEIQDSHPFLNDIFMAATGKYGKDLPDDLKIKFCFIYGILMNIRWHEISLVQRINTVLLIEGGCSKKVWYK